MHKTLHSTTVEEKWSPSCSATPSVSHFPTFRMPKWWSEFVRGEAALNKDKDMLFRLGELNQHGLISLPRGSTTSSSSDDNIPVSLMVPPTYSISQAEEIATQTINNTCTALSTRSFPEDASDSKIHAIESQDKLWEVEQILQMRVARGRGLRAKRGKQYLIQWTPSWLSTEEFRYSQKTWKIVKTSQEIIAERGKASGQNKIRVQWAPSWVSAREFASTL